MEYQSQARRIAWNDDPQVRPGDSFEIVGASVRRAAAAVTNQSVDRRSDLQVPPRAASGPKGWRRALAVAMNEAVEGLALCAASLHPQFFYLQSEPVDRLEPAEHPGYGTRLRPVRPTLSILREVDSRNVPAPRPRLPAVGRGGFTPMPFEVAPLEVTPIEASPNRAVRILSALGRLWARIAAEYNFKRSREVLLALTDRELKDIGIDRHDIDRAVRLGRRPF